MRFLVINLLLLFTFITLKAQNIGFSVRSDYREGITKTNLHAAKTLKDINKGYPSSWISGYISVEIIRRTADGEKDSIVGKNDKLTKDQISLLASVDYYQTVEILVKYQPMTANFKNSEQKEVNFTYTIIPEQEARFQAGQMELRAYVKEKVIDKIPEKYHKEIEMASINFTIDPQGNVIDPIFTETTKFPKIDELMMDCIINMPKWNPAKNNHGVGMIQRFSLEIGNMAGC